MKYDYIIVGAGFAGATCARLLSDHGYKCLIIEERPFVGGNCVTNNSDGINLHILGPHIFHTNNKQIWDFINKYGTFINYKHQVYTLKDNKLYPTAFNIPLIKEFCYEDLQWPDQYKNIINDNKTFLDKPSNAEEYCIKHFGNDIYRTVYKGFYEKMYNKPCKELNINVIQENINCSYTLNNFYYNDIYQGVPKNGYTKLIENIIDGIDIMLNTNFIHYKDKLINIAKNIIYTGEIDRLCKYCIGNLEWLSVNISFSDESENTNNLFGTPVVHFADDKIPYYRATEHKWFDFNNALNNDKTYVLYESYKDWKIGDQVFYCINNTISNNKHKQYVDYIKRKYPNMYLCGRYAEYKNYSMSETIQSAFNLVETLTSNN